MLRLGRARARLAILSARKKWLLASGELQHDGGENGGKTGRTHRAAAAASEMEEFVKVLTHSAESGCRPMRPHKRSLLIVVVVVVVIPTARVVCLMPRGRLQICHLIGGHRSASGSLLPPYRYLFVPVGYLLSPLALSAITRPSHRLSSSRSRRAKCDTLSSSSAQ